MAVQVRTEKAFRGRERSGWVRQSWMGRVGKDELKVWQSSYGEL